jgi:hypothetical protein
MAVTVSYTLTRADLLWLSWVSLRSRPLVLVLFVGVFVVVPWATALWLIYEAVRGVAYAYWSIATLLLIPPLMAVAFVTTPLRVSRGSRVIGGEMTLEFADKEIRYAGSLAQSIIQWSALTKGFGTRHGVLFYSGNLPLISVPGRVLTPETASELRAFASAKGIKIVGPWARL